MKRRRKEVSKSNVVGNIMIGLSVLLLANITSFAGTEKGEEFPIKNQTTISEFEFKHMVLGREADSVAYKINLGQHLWPTINWQDRYDFVIRKIPISTGMDRLRTGKGRMLMNRKRGKN